MYSLFQIFLPQMYLLFQFFRSCDCLTQTDISAVLTPRNEQMPPDPPAAQFLQFKRVDISLETSDSEATSSGRPLTQPQQLRREVTVAQGKNVHNFVRDAKLEKWRGIREKCTFKKILKSLWDRSKIVWYKKIEIRIWNKSWTFWQFLVKLS